MHPNVAAYATRVCVCVCVCVRVHVRATFYGSVTTFAKVLTIKLWSDGDLLYNILAAELYPFPVYYVWGNLRNDITAYRFCIAYNVDHTVLKWTI